MQDPRSTLRKITILAERAATPGERAAALAAAARLRARLPVDNRASAAPAPLPESLRRRVHGLLRVVEEAQPKERASLLHWSASRVREKRASGQIEYEELVAVIEELRRVALAAGLGQWECERSISRAMKMQPLERRR
jgi:hypothetical protein